MALEEIHMSLRIYLSLRKVMSITLMSGSGRRRNTQFRRQWWICVFSTQVCQITIIGHLNKHKGKTKILSENKGDQLSAYLQNPSSLRTQSQKKCKWTGLRSVLVHQCDFKELALTQARKNSPSCEKALGTKCQKMIKTLWKKLNTL